MKIAGIVQARMSSSRLPGKVLKEVKGKTLLEYLLERLQRSERIDKVIVATSSDRSDDLIAEFCRNHRIPCGRGSLLNVADRFRSICDVYDIDAFVRISADSPLFDPALADKAVDLFQQSNADLVTNFRPRTFPKGQSVEVVKGLAFHRAFLRMSEPQHFEHVTTYLYEHPTDFKIENFSAGADYNDVRLVVDTPDDFAVMSGILQRMKQPHWEYGWKDLLALYTEATAPLQTR